MNSLRLQREQYQKGILNGDRLVLAKAITLMESTLQADQQLAGELLDDILPHTGNSLRIGITGSPGVGKSTFIETFGGKLIDAGKKVAILTIDPSSQVSGGSILGDKTRMQELARNARAFIRPSPSGQTLGGVTPHTRESTLLCEAAGFDVIIVETVGTGQSEIAIKSMVDFFLLLMQPGAGDELQGIKKGIVEMADAVVVTKADGENMKAAKIALADYQQALHLQPPQPSGWVPPVRLSSAMEQTGFEEIINMVYEFHKQLHASGHFQANRKRQHAAWFKDHFKFLLSTDPNQFGAVTETADKLSALVQSGKVSPRKAAQELLKTYHQAIKGSQD